MDSMKTTGHNGVVWSLFDGSGIAGLPWAEKNYLVYCFNADSADHGEYTNLRVKHPNICYVDCWIDLAWAESIERSGLPAPDIIFSFPPCTDMAVSGAAHFARKSAKNPLFQVEAVRTAKIAAYLAEFVFDCPYVIENPVSVLSSKWRKPDYSFHPWEYGGYLPEDDVNPFFPGYIKARDAYPKKTCLWTGGGFIMPPRKPVQVSAGYSEQHKKLGGKSEKTKVIRSLTPRGFFRAVFKFNK